MQYADGYYRWIYRSSDKKIDYTDTNVELAMVQLTKKWLESYDGNAWDDGTVFRLDQVKYDVYFVVYQEQVEEVAVHVSQKQHVIALRIISQNDLKSYKVYWSMQNPDVMIQQKENYTYDEPCGRARIHKVGNVLNFLDRCVRDKNWGKLKS